MQTFPLDLAPRSNSDDPDRNTVVLLGTMRCPHCGASMRKARMTLGGVAAHCRRCCYWRIEHPDGLTEEGRKPTGMGIAPDRGYHVYRRAPVRRAAPLPAA